MLEQQRKWEGSIESDDKSGMASFTIGVHSVSIRMNCLQDFLDFSRLFDEAYGQGRRHAVDELSVFLEKAMSDFNEQNM